MVITCTCFLSSDGKFKRQSFFRVCNSGKKLVLNTALHRTNVARPRLEDDNERNLPTYP